MIPDVVLQLPLKLLGRALTGSALAVLSNYCLK